MRRKSKQNQIVMNKIKNIDSKIESVSDHQSPRRVDTEVKDEDEDEIDIKRVQTESFDNDEDEEGEIFFNR